MNIRVDMNTPINDGTEVVFRSPVDCSQITGLIVYYNGESKEFAFADAHGNNVGDIDHLFAENVVVKVILDVTTGMAFVQNADTNAYLEGRFKELEDKIGKGGGSAPTPDYSVYFDIDVDGVVSLKPEYRGLGSTDTEQDETGNTVYLYPESHSDNGVDYDGSAIHELPEMLVIPDVIGGIAVSSMADGMFLKNYRVKSVTIPSGVTTLPRKVFGSTIKLEEVKGTENIEVICQAAFQFSGIKKAMFPNLKSFEGVGQFNCAPNLMIVDIGNTIKTIPQNFFAYCDRLSLVRGGASVTGIETKAFHTTRSLKILSIVSNVKNIQKEAFVLSRVTNIGSGYSDWWDFKDNSGCAFNTNAIPAFVNKTKWWDGCTYTPCENPLGSTFHQRNPEWATYQIPNSADTYGTGCLETSAAHIYSALTGVKFDSPRFFVEDIIGEINNGNLYVPSGTDSEGNAVYNYNDMQTWLTALGLQCELLTYNTTNLQTIYEALADGALVLTSIHPNHAGVIYGIAENGEMLVLDSDGINFRVKDYTARTYQQPIWSFAVSGKNALIVRKPSKEG